MNHEEMQALGRVLEHYLRNEAEHAQAAGDRYAPRRNATAELFPPQGTWYEAQHADEAAQPGFPICRLGGRHFAEALPDFNQVRTF